MPRWSARATTSAANEPTVPTRWGLDRPKPGRSTATRRTPDLRREVIVGVAGAAGVGRAVHVEHRRAGGVADVVEPEGAAVGQRERLGQAHGSSTLSAPPRVRPGQDGGVQPIVTPTEMAAIDAAAPEPVEELIERAGAAVARVALTMLGGAYGRRVVILVGKGNNGADGRAAARRLEARGVRCHIVDAAAAAEVVRPADLVIDAAYGTGFRGTYDAPRWPIPTCRCWPSTSPRA